MSPIATAFAPNTSPANVFYALSRRADIQSTFDNVKASFSSWDACMSKAYCKWPVIAAIIIASLIVLSLVVSLARCLCCGLECCFACCACCNACCPAPRGGSRKDSGGTYKQQQQWPQQQQQAYAYQQPMMYGPPGGAGGTATFDSPSKGNGRVHEDALPMMPTWDTANTKRVEHPEDDDDDAHLDHEDAGNAVPGQQSFAMGPVSPAGGLPPSPQRLISYGGDEARQSLLAPQPQRPIQQTALQSPVHSPTYGYEDTSYTSPVHGYSTTSELDSGTVPQGYAANPYHDNSYNSNSRPAQTSYASPALSYHTQQPMSNIQQHGGYTSPPPQQRQGGYTSPPPQQAQNTGYYGANPYSSAPAPYQQSQDMGTAYASPAPQRMPSGGYNNQQYGGNTYREV